MVQKAAASAVVAGRIIVALALRELSLHDFADHFALGAQAGGGDLCLYILNDEAHLFGRGAIAGGAHLGDGRFDERANLRLVSLLRHIALDDLDLSGFLFGELEAIALGELLDGVPTLLDEGGERLQNFSIRERGALIDLLVFDGRLDHAQYIEPGLRPLFHGCDGVLLDALLKCHASSSPGSPAASLLSKGQLTSIKTRALDRIEAKEPHRHDSEDAPFYSRSNAPPSCRAVRHGCG